MNLLEPEFRHEDSRRVLTQLFTASVKQVNLYEAKKGAIQGNHYHKETIEYFLIITGSVRYNGKRELGHGDLFMVVPQENHTLECLTDVTMVTFLTKPYSEKDRDIWKREY